MGRHSAPEPESPEPSASPQISTQTAYPWRTGLRTLVQFCFSMLPFATLYLIDASSTVQSAAAIAIIPILLAVTRFLGRPDVDAVLKQYFPWLATTPKASATPSEPHKEE